MESFQVSRATFFESPVIAIAKKRMFDLWWANKMFEGKVSERLLLFYPVL